LPAEAVGILEVGLFEWDLNAAVGYILKRFSYYTFINGIDLWLRNVARGQAITGSPRKSVTAV